MREILQQRYRAQIQPLPSPPPPHYDCRLPSHLA
jgi:hypothetical protein